MTDSILKMHNADIGYRLAGSEKILLKNLNLGIRQGELVCLIGKNGSGKTTLLKTLMKLQSLMGGEIFYGKKNLEEFDRTEFARFFGFVSTGHFHAEQMNIRELVEVGRFPYTNWIGKMGPEDKKAVRDALEWVGLSAMQDKKLSEISDGEKQRAMIARTLAQDTEFILLDEPSAYLDIPNKYEITNLLKKLCALGKTVLFSTHDLHLSLQYADKIWLIDNDSILEGAPEDLIINGTIEKIFNSLHIGFEKSSGEFESVISHNKLIYLKPTRAKNLIINWTKKAMRRVGYQVCKEEDGKIPHLEILENNDQIIWKVKNENENLLFENLYELNCYLTKNRNL